VSGKPQFCNLACLYNTVLQMCDHMFMLRSTFWPQHVAATHHHSLSWVQIDRRSLPRQEFKSTAEYVAPSGHTEEVVHAAWQAVLPCPDRSISVHDNFFQVGALPSAIGTVGCQ
jgi:hypothetical protein